MLQHIDVNSEEVMTAENFVYWLNGLFELNPDTKKLSEEQVKIIKEHIALVLNKYTGSVVVGSGSNISFGPNDNVTFTTTENVDKDILVQEVPFNPKSDLI